MVLRDKFNKLKGNREAYTVALYSLCFAVLSLLVFSWIYLNGLTFIDGGDSLTQHFKAFTYYAKYIRNIILTLLREHRLVMPRFYFGLGEGGDIIGTLHYYGIGDPIALIGVFCPERYMYIGYALAQVVRIYISGLFFIFLAKETIERPSLQALVAGGCIYAFSAFTMNFFCGHSFFLNAMEYLPLIICGIERVFRKKSPYMLILGVMFAALSNFYFFYMMGIMAAVYCIVRAGVLYHKELKTAFAMLLRLAASALLGMVMAGVILLPQLYVFLGNPKNGLKFLDPPLFDIWYYMELPGLLISARSFGTVGIILPALIFLFMQRKKYLTVKISACIVLVFLLFPFFGSVFNGFSHSLDRWIFLAVLLEAYIITLMWDRMFEMEARQGWLVFIACLIYFAALILLEGVDTKYSLTGMAEAFIFLFLCTERGRGGAKVLGRDMYQLTAFLCALLFVFISWFYMFSPSEGGRRTLKVEKTLKTEVDSTDVVRDIAAKEGFDDFYRVVNIGGINPGLLTGLSSTSFYLSTLNPYEDEFMQTLGMRNNDSVAPFDYDERTIATDIASVRYYGDGYDRDIPNVPYGFSMVGKVDYSESRRNAKLEELKAELGVDTLTEGQRAEIEEALDSKGSIYKNDYFLPMGFAYDHYYSLEDAHKLNLLEREDIMLDAAVLDLSQAPEPEVSALDYESNVVSLPYTLEYDEEKLKIDGNKYITTSGGTELIINIGADTSGMELMVGMDGLTFEPVTDYQRYFGDDELYDPSHLYSRTAFELKEDSEKREILRQPAFEKNWKTSFSFVDEYGRKKGFNYFSPYDKKYSGKHEFLVNFGYGDIGVSTVVVAFAEPGIYNINELLVYGHVMTDFAERNAKLKENVLMDENVGVDEISGNVSFDKPKLLYLSVPYSAGWEAFVDGNRQELYRANYMYSALDIPAGEHEVCLKYHTPYLLEGSIASCVGWCIFVTLIIINSRKRKEEKLESHVDT